MGAGKPFYYVMSFPLANNVAATLESAGAPCLSQLLSSE